MVCVDYVDYLLVAIVSDRVVMASDLDLTVAVTVYVAPDSATSVVVS